MFRDSEEYQKLQKLYEEKVSKPKQLDEFTGLGVKGAVKQAQELKSKQGSSFRDSVKMGEKLRSQNNNNTTTSTTTTETPKKRFQSRFGKKQEPVKSPMEAGMGDGAARARAMAKARIAAKKANPNQKQLSGRERAQALAKARIAARKGQMNNSFIPDGETIEERLGGKGVSKKAAAGSIYPGEKGDGQTEDQDRGAGNKAKKRAGETVEKKSPTFMAYIKNKNEDKKEDKKESFDAYDLVLNYLISTEQAATIEEANYIMTEMDAKTIQDIISQQLNEQN